MNRPALLLEYAERLYRTCRKEGMGHTASIKVVRNNFPTVHLTFMAKDRKETEPCQRLTPGCSVDHDLTGEEGECETW